MILITAARDVDTLQQAMRGGVVDYLLKPVMLPRLEAALKKYQSQQQEFESVSDLNQGLVDKMLQANAKADSRKVSTLPKGIDGVTLDKIRAIFQQADIADITADEAVNVLGRAEPQLDAI